MTSVHQIMDRRERSSSAGTLLEQFGDCALVEIVHLHDCLRGALKELQKDVTELNQSVLPVGQESKVAELAKRVASRFTIIWSVFRAHSAAEDEFIWPALRKKNRGQIPHLVEQEAYIEDHADEEEMFQTMDKLLTKLRNALSRHGNSYGPVPIAKEIKDKTEALIDHLMVHLHKEESQCMPLVMKHFTKEEIHDLVGQIMGKRSSDTIAQILNMAVQNLNESDRDQMVRYMKEAMMDTYFERWLTMSGWMSTDNKKSKSADGVAVSSMKRSATNKLNEIGRKKTKQEDNDRVTSKEDLEKRIKLIARNQVMTSVERNASIQNLRDSFWKKNRNPGQYAPATTCTAVHPNDVKGAQSRTIPPAAYYKEGEDGKSYAVWTNRYSVQNCEEDLPLFSAAELAPTFHDGANGGIFGCPHYSRSCKLRHPTSGRLYTCRLCCTQERENPMKEKDAPLDRYSVMEVFCMKCTTLQPASEGCINPQCQSKGARFAKYYCNICHLYDDGAEKNIYHCPFCNVCRSGRGLGIDFKHCMRCNACVSLSEDHRCIPQRLQATCPICQDSMFESTEPLRALKCGHVMHLSCFTTYIRYQSYTCPLCMKSVDDMREYFSMLDAAVRMQPMPAEFMSMVSQILCQDCSKTSTVPYHFIGCKCGNCGSYNTREMKRYRRAC